MTGIDRNRFSSYVTRALTCAAIVAAVGASWEYWQGVRLGRRLVALRSEKGVWETTTRGRGSSPPVSASPASATDTPSSAGKIAATQPKLATVPPLTWVAVHTLRDSGRATPLASFESAVCAAFRGDVDALASMLFLSPADRAKAEAFLAGLPTPNRNAYRTPERLLALMMCRDAPSAIELYSVEPGKSANSVQVCAFSQDTAGTPRLLWYTFCSSPNGWSLATANPPTPTLASYLKELAGNETGTNLALPGQTSASGAPSP